MKKMMSKERKFRIGQEELRASTLLFYPNPGRDLDRAVRRQSEDLCFTEEAKNCWPKVEHVLLGFRKDYATVVGIKGINRLRIKKGNIIQKALQEAIKSDQTKYQRTYKMNPDGRKSGLRKLRNYNGLRGKGNSGEGEKKVFFMEETINRRSQSNPPACCIGRCPFPPQAVIFRRSGERGRTKTREVQRPIE